VHAEFHERMWRLPLILVFVLAISSACGDSAAEDAETTRAPEFEPTIEDIVVNGVLNNVLSATVRENLQRQAWIGDGSYETSALVFSIGVAEEVLKPTGMSQGVEELLLGAEASAWYRDGVSAEDKDALRAAFDGLSLGTKHGPSLPWPSLLLEALNKRMFVQHSVGNQSLIFLAVAAEPAHARQALALTSSLIQGVRNFWGTARFENVLIVVDESSNRCLVKSPTPFMLLGPSCLEPITIAHELSHLFTAIAPTWFIDGMAEYASASVNGVLESYDRPARDYLERNGWEPTFRLNGYPGDSANLHDYASGVLFIKDVSEILGDDAIRRIGRNAKANMTGEQVLDLIRSESNPSIRAQLDVLISSRVVY